MGIGNALNIDNGRYADPVIKGPIVLGAHSTVSLFASQTADDTCIG